MSDLPSNPKANVKDARMEADEAELARMGYKQELKYVALYSYRWAKKLIGAALQTRVGTYAGIKTALTRFY